MNRPEQNQSGKPVRRAAGRTALFYTTSILLPFLLLGGVELALRGFHYGYDADLFTEYKQDKNFLVMNPDASRKYFNNQDIATTGNTELFKKKKDDQTFRIFILGESTAIGYPYFHNGSFHRWLQYRLSRSYPDTNFEIINLALTAVNSYTVLGFARQIVDYKPDAVLIYTGHNEYYGALGVGSTENIGGDPRLVNLILWLRDFKITQLLNSVYSNVYGVFNTKNHAPAGTRMRMMVADQEIQYHSELYNMGVEQFRSNMLQTLDLLQAHKIPVFVSNLVSNEKDLTPFVSFPVDYIKFPGFEEKFNPGTAAFKSGDFSLADSLLKAAYKVYPAHALCNYYLGQMAYGKGDFKEAEVYFSKARDLDGLRFRAPEEFNRILSVLCGKFSNAHLVDTQSIFEANSPHHVIGDELILEHVHPDLKGYALMSDVFYRTMVRTNILRGNKTEMGLSQLLKEMPITRVDSLYGLFKVDNLKRSWPFNTALKQTAEVFKDGSAEEKLAHSLATKKIGWADAMNSLYEKYTREHDLSRAGKVVEALILEYPADAQLNAKAGMISGELKDYNLAVYYFKKAFSMAPSFDHARFLFVLLFKLDKPAEAMPYLDYAIHNNHQGFNLSPVKMYAQQIIQLKKNYKTDTVDIKLMNRIAGLYIKMDNKDGASAYIGKVLKADSRNQEAIGMRAHIQGMIN